MPETNMPEFTLIDAEARPYLYEERTCPMDPKVISHTMGDAWGAVLAVMDAAGVAPAGMPLTVYETFDPDALTFRAGIPVDLAGLAAASGNVRAAHTPAGRVVTFTHVGPYETLSQSFQKMMAFLEAEGLRIGGPSWEVYVDDPDETPAEELRTEVFAVVA